ncbi:probable E3 ubiquitin-protein ligase MID2 [Crassostrea angulata]|uniref:probable E3 ubiquitin-protein ligase MID2 n=1 Tax=Magallana angulata TaxID=2784310 RepID=UPI0022B1D7BD|nr:probable E3 ubiquitin-protein ligase MID2 [Crassostrea angulata]
MATVEGETPELSCPICLEKFNNPKKLPCLHTFCELCIQSYVQVQKSATEEENTAFFRCPLCRFETYFTNLSGVEWSQKLPNDYLITSLLDRKSNDPNSNEIYCEPCKYANEKNVATYLCRDCKECMCDQCYNYSHKRKRNNHMHLVTSITPDTDLKPLESYEPCPVHINKVLEVFCFDHRKICCSICFATEHRTCDIVKSLDEVEMNEEEIIDVDDFVYTISCAKDSTSTALNEANVKLTHLDDNKKMMLQSLVDIIEKTKSHLDTLHEELKVSIEKTFSNTEQSQQFGIECMTAFKKMLIHSQKIAEAVEEHGSEKQKFVTMETTKMAIEKHFERLRLAFNVSETSTQYVLDFEDNLMNVQNWSKLASLNSQQSDDSLADINKTLCSLGCFKDYTVFQHYFALEHTVQKVMLVGDTNHL